MFILNNKPISPDAAFEHEGIQYPANWLRLATPEERASIGITEVPDEPFYDQRFYWGVDNPKDHVQLVNQWVSQTKATARSLISPTDWMVTRSAEPNGKPVSQDVLDERASIRQLSNTKEADIKATTSTDELAAYIASPSYTSWN